MEDVLTESPRILLVDDDLGSREILTRILHRKGYETETAATGREALERAQERDFDLAFLDVKLPDVAGVDLIAPLRKIHSHMAVIMVTGHASTETAIQALNEGASGYVTKPLHPDELLVVARDALEKQRLAERKQRAERALRASEERYRTLFEGMPVGLYRTTPEGRILHANQALLDILGYPGRGALTQVHVGDLYVDAEQRERERALLERKGVVRGFEIRLRRRDGSVIWVRDSARAVRRPKGSVAYLEGSLEDITERKRAEEALQEREQLLTNVFESMEEGVLVLNADFQYTYWNSSMERISHTPREEVLGRVPWERFPFLRGDIEEAMKSAMRGDVSRDIELAYTLPSGKEGWTSESYFPLKDADERIVGVVGVVQDITERKQAEEALRESEERYRTLFERLPVGVFRSTPDGRFLDANPAHVELLGCPDLETLLATPVTDFYAEPEQRQHWKAVAEYEGAGQAWEARWQQLDGTPVWVREYARAVQDDDGRVLYYQGIVVDITERKRAREALRESRERLELALQGGDLGTWDWNVQTDEMLIDERWAGQLGYTLDELEPRLSTWEGIVHPDDLPAAYEKLNAHLAGETPSYEAECRMRHKSGDWVWILDRGRVIERDAEGNPLRACGTHLDITDAKRAEAEKEATIQELRLINETVVEAGRMEDVDAMCRLVAETVHGVNEDAYVFVSLYDPDDDVIRIRAMKGLGDKAGDVFDILGDDPGKLAFPPRGMGEATPLFTSGQLEHVPGGIHAVTGGLLTHSACRALEQVLEVDEVHTVGFALGDEPRGGIILLLPADQEVAYRSAIETIASQISTMVHQRQAEEALRQSRALLNTTQHMAKVGGWEWDVESETMYWTDETYRIHGFDPATFDPGSEEHVTRSLECYDPKDRPVVWNAFERCMTEAEPYDLELPFTTVTGRRLWIRAVGNPVERDGRVVKVIGNMMDITEQREMEERLRRQERLAAVGQLAGGIAHDFNNILAAIVLYAQIPLRRPDLPPTIENALETILEESHRAADLVQQVLDFSGSAMMDTEPVGLVDLAQETVTLLQRTIPESIRLVTDMACRPCTIEADATRIHQVLMNLALNARDAMPEGGELRIQVERIKVTPDTAPPLPDIAPGAWVRLTVSDTGTGMSKDVQDHLFEPFFTTKAKGEGTGLGLAQVYGIVKQHEGFIDVETAEGEGTTFTILLPLVEGRGDEDEGEIEGHALRGRGETILVVEDAVQTLRAIKDGLEALNYRVVTATNGQEALEAVARHDVDLVVTDVVMPEMDGKELLRELRARAPHLKVIAMTGYVMDMDASGLLAAGFAEALSKPFSMETLTQVVREVLEGR